MADEPQVAAAPAAEPAAAPSPAPEPAASPTPAATDAPAPRTSERPASPHRKGQSWDNMKGLFEKRDGKPGFRGKEAAKPSSAEPPPEIEKVSAPKNAAAPTTDASDPVASLLAEEPPEHFEEKGRSHFKAMKEKWHGVVTQTKTEVDRLTKLLAEREGLTKKETEDLRSELTKAKRYEYAFDIQSDPQFQEKFIKPANETFKALGDTLKRAGYDASAAQQIDWDDEIAVESVAMQLQEKQGAAIANVFRNKASELRGIRASFNAERTNAITNYDKIVEEKAKERELKTTEREGRIKTALDQIYSKKDDKGEVQFSFLQHKQVPVNATDEVKAQIAEHNAFVDQSRKRIDQLSRTDEPEDRAGLAVAAELGIVLSQERQHLLKQVKDLEASLSEIQQGRTMSKSAAKVPEAPKERYARGQSAAESFAKKFGA